VLAMTFVTTATPFANHVTLVPDRTIAWCTQVFQTAVYDEPTLPKGCTRTDVPDAVSSMESVVEPNAPIEKGRENDWLCALSQNSTVQSPVPRGAEAAGTERMLEVEPLKFRLPLEPAGADALHTTPTAVVLTLAPLESAKGAELLRAARSSIVPETTCRGDGGVNAIG
jgi:hypothetical protein